MRILFCYESIGIHNIPFYLSKSLKKLGHDVINCGPGKNQDIKTSLNENIENILKKSGPVDLIFIEESSFIPKNLENCPTPKAIHFVDSHLHFDIWHKELAKTFDFIFFAQNKYVQKMKRGKFKNVFYLPWAYDPLIYKDLNLKRDYDIGFVGTFNNLHNPKRTIVFTILKKMFKAKIAQKTYGEDLAKIYSRSKIGINLSSGSDLNPRTFEIMASGALLITDPQDNMISFFKDKRHLVIYNHLFQIPTLIKRYLKNDPERLKIAKQGQKEVLTKHTYDLRAIEIIKNLNSHLTTKKTADKTYSYGLGRTYFFLYNRPMAIFYLKKFVSSEKQYKIKKIESYIFKFIAESFSPVFYRMSIAILRKYYRYQAYFTFKN